MKPTTSYQPIPLPDFQELPLETMRANAEAFYAEMRARHTVREFSTRPVPRDIIETCILTAGTAPNGANHQPWHFAVIGDATIKKRIREAAEIEERAIVLLKKFKLDTKSSDFAASLSASKLNNREK